MSKKSDTTKPLPYPIQLLGTVTLGPKGQVVIPVQVREAMDIKPGDKLVALYQKERQAISFIPETALQPLIEKMGDRIDLHSADKQL